VNSTRPYLAGSNMQWPGGLIEMATWVGLPWPSPRLRPAWPAQLSGARTGTLWAKHRTLGADGGAVSDALPVYAVPRGLHRKHERPWGSTPCKVRQSEAHLSGLEARRNGGMAGFKGGSGSPANGGGFSMVLQRSGPSRDVRGRLNRSKTH
jgi:hypothetical protein